MTVKRKYIIGILNDDYVSECGEIISKYSIMAEESSSHMYFFKQPIDSHKIPKDVIFFHMKSESEEMMDKKVQELIGELNELNADYVLRDEGTGEMLVVVKYGGQIAVSLDNLKFIEPGTFEKIDELKCLRTDLGYSRGFKPNFRPIEGNSVEDMEVEEEIIYIFADSEEHLLKFRDYVIDKVCQINPEFECEFTWFFHD